MKLSIHVYALSGGASHFLNETKNISTSSKFWRNDYICLYEFVAIEKQHKTIQQVQCSINISFFNDLFL